MMAKELNRRKALEAVLVIVLLMNLCLSVFNFTQLLKISPIPDSEIKAAATFANMKGCDFIIWNYTTTYFAVSGYTGRLFSSSADGDTLVNAVLAGAEDGDYIVVGCNVTIGSNLNGGNLDYITFEGFSKGTWIVAANGLNADMLTIGNFWTIRSLSFDGNEGNQNDGHGVYGDRKIGNLIEDCYFYGIFDSAVMIEGTVATPSKYWKVMNNHFKDCGDDNALNNVHRCVYVYYSDHILVSGNTAYNGSHIFVQTNHAYDVVVSENTCEAFFDAGSNHASFIEFYVSWACVADSNTLKNGNGEGVGARDGGSHVISNNVISDIGTTNSVSQQAIILNSGCSGSIIEGNIVNGTYGTASGGTGDGHGIYIYASSDNIVRGNTLIAIGSSPICVSGAGSDNNEVYGNHIVTGYNRFGIEIATTGTPTSNRIGPNYIAFSGYGRFTDAGSDTRLQSIVLPISATNGTTLYTLPGGAEIDAADEVAIIGGTIPELWNQLFRIKVFGIALAADADGMCLALEAYGGASSEAYTTETVVVVDEASTTTTIAVGDVVTWSLGSADDGDLDDFMPWDVIKIRIEYNAASGAYIATDAVIQCVVLEGV
jgi:hypothetical protein